MEAYDVGTREQFVLGGARRAGGGGLLVGQVRAPRKHLHVERAAIARHQCADAPEPHDANGLFAQNEANRHAALERAGADCRIARRNPPGRRKHQSQRHLGRRRARWTAAGMAHDDAAIDHCGDVDQRGARAGEVEHPEIRQPAGKRCRERRAFACRQHDIEELELRGGVILAVERLLKEHDIGTCHQRRPIGAATRDVLPVVENGDTAPLRGAHSRLRSKTSKTRAHAASAATGS